jgi:hypothetical protein
MFEFELAFFSNFELFEFLKIRGVRGFEVWENPSLFEIHYWDWDIHNNIIIIMIMYDVIRSK